MTPKVIVVLSPPRSGSSALTSMLKEYGLHMGPKDNLKRGGEHNKYGYFENITILRLNEEILARSYSNPAAEILKSTGLNDREVYKALSSWHWCGHYEPVPASLGLDADIRSRMSEIADNASLGDTAALWKDARFCITLPVWETLIDPICIILWRAPRETASSIADMTSIPHRIGLDLWYSYTRAAAEVSAKHPHLVVSHDLLMRDPAKAASALSGFLDRNGLAVTPDMAARAAMKIDLSQYRHRGDQEEDKLPLGPHAEELLRWLQHPGTDLPPPVPPTVPAELLPLIGAAWYVKRRNPEKLKDLLRSLPGYDFLRKLYGLRRNAAN